MRCDSQGANSNNLNIVGNCLRFHKKMLGNMILLASVYFTEQNGPKSTSVYENGIICIICKFAKIC